MYLAMFSVSHVGGRIIRYLLPIYLLTLGSASENVLGHWQRMAEIHLNWKHDPRRNPIFDKNTRVGYRSGD